MALGIDFVPFDRIVGVRSLFSLLSFTSCFVRTNSFVKTRDNVLLNNNGRLTLEPNRSNGRALPLITSDEIGNLSTFKCSGGRFCILSGKLLKSLKLQIVELLGIFNQTFELLKREFV